MQAKDAEKSSVISSIISKQDSEQLLFVDSQNEEDSSNDKPSSADLTGRSAFSRPNTSISVGSQQSNVSQRPLLQRPSAIRGIAPSYPLTSQSPALNPLGVLGS
jgi:hypothetical protein